MGLNTTHGCFHGAYSAFNRFRYSLGYQIGINLDDYEGYSNQGKNLNEINHELMPLFDHSDCDGQLSVKECESIVIGEGTRSGKKEHRGAFNYYVTDKGNEMLNVVL